MKKSLKSKILIGVPVIFIAVMLMVTFVVSVILSKQNRKTANTLINNAFSIIRYTMAEKREKLLSDSHQMATIDNMGRKINYVIESSSYFKYDTLRPTYIKVAGAIYSTSATAGIWKAGVYDSNSNLMAFTLIEEDRSILGCIHDMQTVEVASLKPQEELTDESWARQDSLPTGIEYNFGKAVPSERTVHFEIVDGSLCLVAYRPVMAEEYNVKTEKMEEKQVGMVVAVQKFDSAFVEKMSELSGTSINILTSETMIAGSYAGCKTFDLGRLADAESGWTLTEQPVTFSDVDIAESSYFQGVLPVYSDSKCIAAIVCLYSKEMAKANTRQIIKLLSLVYFVGIVLIVPITILVVVRGVINPIEQIASMMREIARKKDFTKMLKIETNDEIGDLASSFNEMSENLRKTTTSIDNLNKEIAERKKAEEGIKKSRKVLQDMIDSMPFGVMVVGRDKKVRQANTTARQLTGYSEDELVGCLCHQTLCPAYKDNCPIIDQHQEVDNSERKLVTKEGREIPVIKSVVQLKLGDEDVLLEAFVNITDRKEVEKKLKRLNEDLENAVADLEEANQEMKNFVYIASHDLREPLRKIAAFGAMLEQSVKGKISSDDLENLRFMIDGSNRMTKMIEGLLVYSRVSTQAQPAQTVDLNEIVTQLQQLELAVLIEEKQVTVEIPKPLPCVEVDPVQMRQLMQNLIANGVKYQEKENTPCITITFKPAAEGMVRIEVKDNGIGVAPEHQQSVFTMFKRLHNRSEYEGTGIGLSVCKKIVERHGGKIGVESKPGEGSTFWFTIPAAHETVAAEEGKEHVISEKSHNKNA